jgi:excisionase family DNA binding protein
MITTSPRWATIAQVAAYTGFSTRTIRQRIADGDLIAHKPYGSRIWLIDLDDVDQMITGQGHESLAARIRRVLAENGDQIPDPTDEQIALVARLLPRPPARPGDSDAA